MGSRALGAFFALAAAVLFGVSIASQAWWTGHPDVDGHTISAKDVHISPLGALGCNTGGDGSCEPIALEEMFTFANYGVLGATGLAALFALIVMIAALRIADRRRGISTASILFTLLAAGGGGALVALGPGIEATQIITVPIGWGTFAFGGAVVASLFASLITRRLEKEPLRLKPSLQQMPMAPPDLRPLYDPHGAGKQPVPPAVDLPPHAPMTRESIRELMGQTPPPRATSQPVAATLMAPAPPPPAPMHLPRDRAATPLPNASPSAPATPLPDAPLPTAPSRAKAPSAPPGAPRTRPPSMPPRTQSPTSPPNVPGRSQSPTSPPNVPGRSQSPSSPPGAPARSQSPSSPPGAPARSQSPSSPPGAPARSQPPTSPPGAPARSPSPSSPPSAPARSQPPTSPPSAPARSQPPTSPPSAPAGSQLKTNPPRANPPSSPPSTSSPLPSMKAALAAPPLAKKPSSPGRGSMPSVPMPARGPTPAKRQSSGRLSTEPGTPPPPEPVTRGSRPAITSPHHEPMRGSRPPPPVDGARAASTQPHAIPPMPARAKTDADESLAEALRETENITAVEIDHEAKAAAKQRALTDVRTGKHGLVEVTETGVEVPVAPPDGLAEGDGSSTEQMDAESPPDITGQTQLPIERNPQGTPIPTIERKQETPIPMLETGERPAPVSMSTASTSLPPPKKLSDVPSGPTPACPQCESPMSWVEEHLRFYCRQCRMYF